MNDNVVLEVWGDFACFTRPESKVERLTYPVPTPSAARGVLNAIYFKVDEFYWQINQIDVLNPIQYISFKRNEVKKKVNKTPIKVDDDDCRTQRQTVALKNVRYRIYAEIHTVDGFKGNEKALYEQARRRIKQGKCYYQPYLGCREFVSYFEESDMLRKPISVDFDLGYMLYDVFDYTKVCDIEKAKPYITIFNAKLDNGRLKVPEFHSNEVLKPEEV